MHRDLKAENLLLDNNMNIKIAGNWGTAGSNVINCEFLCWVFAERELQAEIWSISTDDIKLSQKTSVFYSFP